MAPGARARAARAVLVAAVGDCVLQTGRGRAVRTTAATAASVCVCVCVCRCFKLHDACNLARRGSAPLYAMPCHAMHLTCAALRSARLGHRRRVHGRAIYTGPCSEMHRDRHRMDVCRKHT